MQHPSLAHSRFENEPYPELRQLLAPELGHLSDDQVEALLGGIFEGASAEDMENFLRSLKKFGKKALPFVQKALPVVATVAGTALGGPVGATLGGLAGQAASGAIGAATARGGGGLARRLARVGAGVGQQALRQAGGGALRAVQGGGSPAAAQLLQLLSRPQTLQALGSMALGAAGQRQVPVGSSSVPLGAITNLLGVLANQAAAEYHAITAGESGGTPSYLLDEAGEFMVDPMDPNGRAEALLLRFAEDDELAAEALRAEDDGEDDERLHLVELAREADELDAFYDELELLELDDELDEEDLEDLEDSLGSWS